MKLLLELVTGKQAGRLGSSSAEKSLDVCNLTVSQQCAGGGGGMFPMFLRCHSHVHLPSSPDGVNRVGFLGEKMPIAILSPHFPFSPPAPFFHQPSSCIFCFALENTIKCAYTANAHS